MKQPFIFVKLFIHSCKNNIKSLILCHILALLSLLCLFLLNALNFHSKFTSSILFFLHFSFGWRSNWIAISVKIRLIVPMLSHQIVIKALHLWVSHGHRVELNLRCWCQIVLCISRFVAEVPWHDQKKKCDSKLISYK